jgi:hypothetical protein
VEKLISEGDKLVDKGKYAKALKKYQKAHDLDPNCEGLYEKLLSVHEKSLDEKDWDMKDFTEHIDLVMEKQEHEYPPIKQTYAKLSPEWKDTYDLIFKVLSESDDVAAGPLIEELVAKGDIATRALIDMLRNMQKGMMEQEQANEEGGEET